MNALWWVVAAPQATYDLVPWIPAFVVTIGGVVAGVFALWNRRGGERAKRTPTWAELATENRLQRDELRAAANELRGARAEYTSLGDDYTDLRREFEDFRDQVTGQIRLRDAVLRAAAEQWPAGHPAPSFDHLLDLDQIDGILPPAWRRVPPVT